MNYVLHEQTQKEVDQMAERLQVLPQVVIQEALTLLKWVIAEHDGGANFIIGRSVPIIDLPIIGQIHGTSYKEIIFPNLKKNA